MNYTCQFCGKSYVKESTLSAHLCEPKRRHNQRNDWGVQLGFKAYLRFYELTQANHKNKTYEDFCNSQSYTAFVKYGWHTMAIRVINVSSYTDWLLKNNKKLDEWCTDKLYKEWLSEYIKKEAVQDAVERSLKEMQEYADDDKNGKLVNGDFSNYFRLGVPNRIIHHISSGRISPWVIYNCDSGVQFLETLNEDQLSTIIPWIDPDTWQLKFKHYSDDVIWVKNILATAGL